MMSSFNLPSWFSVDLVDFGSTFLCLVRGESCAKTL
jgi:hypothetical protein